MQDKDKAQIRDALTRTVEEILYGPRDRHLAANATYDAVPLPQEEAEEAAEDVRRAKEAALRALDAGDLREIERTLRGLRDKWFQGERRPSATTSEHDGLGQWLSVLPVVQIIIRESQA